MSYQKKKVQSVLVGANGIQRDTHKHLLDRSNGTPLGFLSPCHHCSMSTRYVSKKDSSTVNSFVPMMFDELSSFRSMDASLVGIRSFNGGPLAGSGALA